MLGKEWVGKGATWSSDGKALISENKLRQYRPPSQKKRGVQANFEQRSLKDGKFHSNGHLDIVD